jgi:hypothetical protein
VTAYDAEVLAQQLAALGRDLSEEVTILGELEEECVTAEGEYRKLQEAHEDDIARAFVTMPGGVESRKAAARLECIPSREVSGEAYIEWNRLKGRLRTQQANIQAVHRRIEVGRSLLSREKALISLAGVAEV